MSKCWWCKRPSRLSERIDLENRIDDGEVKRMMTADEVSLLTGDLWGPRAAMLRKLGRDYIEILNARELPETVTCAR